LASAWISPFLALEIQIAGTTPLPKNLQWWIREMASDNPSWGEERVANELKLKLGIRVSSRTVAKYLRDGRPVRTLIPHSVGWLSSTTMPR
jgi:hypothetical protein